MDDLKDVPLPERPSRLYYLGLTTIILIAVAGIVTHFVVLHRVMNLEEEKAAWNAAVDQRLQEEKRLSAQLQSRRDEYLTIQKSADAAKAYYVVHNLGYTPLRRMTRPLCFHYTRALVAWKPVVQVTDSVVSRRQAEGVVRPAINHSSSQAAG